MGVFGRVAHSLHHRLPRSNKAHQHGDLPQRLRGACALLCLLGLTYIFAFLSIGAASAVFQYIFSLSNTLQGFFIFLFHCCLKVEVRQAWKGILDCSRWRACLQTNKHDKESGSGYGSELLSRYLEGTDTLVTSATKARFQGVMNELSVGSQLRETCDAELA